MRVHARRSGPRTTSSASSTSHLRERGCASDGASGRRVRCSLVDQIRARRARARQARRRDPAPPARRDRDRCSRPTASAICASSTSPARSGRRPRPSTSTSATSRRRCSRSRPRSATRSTPLARLARRAVGRRRRARRGARARRRLRRLLGPPPRRVAHPQPRGAGGRRALPRGAATARCSSSRRASTRKIAGVAGTRRVVATRCRRRPRRAALVALIERMAAFHRDLEPIGHQPRRPRRDDGADHPPDGGRASNVTPG